jgi:hypothetical protein
MLLSVHIEDRGGFVRELETVKTLHARISSFYRFFTKTRIFNRHSEVKNYVKN